MTIKEEVFLSALSVVLGVIGTWIVIRKSYEDAKEKLFAERRASILIEEKVKAIDQIQQRLESVLANMDDRLEELERSQISVQAMIQVLMGQRDK